jgi:polysaccharide biosynthesis/export protein
MNSACAAKSACITCVLAGFIGGTPAARSQNPAQGEDSGKASLQTEFIRDYKTKLPETSVSGAEQSGNLRAPEYRIGTNDLLEINVFDVPELNRKLRVAASGEISMPLLGSVQAGGLTAQELETVLESRLRKYMKDPHVGVLVSTVESHPISVLGAVHKPGVFQVRGPKSVLEMLSMAEGLADDAGDSVLVMRGAGLRSNSSLDNGELQTDSRNANASLQANPNGQKREQDPQPEATGDPQTIQVNLRNLLQSEDPRLNVTVYPGDIVKVVRAGLVYVVGEVKKPGGFVLKGNERMTVLKAIALAEGFTPTSKRTRAKIIRPSSINGANQEISINLAKILAGKAPDPTLTAADVVFVPNSNGKTVAYKGSEAAISTLISLFIWRW